MSHDRIMKVPSDPIVDRFPDGYYSTVVNIDGVVETMWFGEDGTVELAGRSAVHALKHQHIRKHRARREEA